MITKSVQKAIVPISNSSNGKVVETVDELSKYNDSNSDQNEGKNSITILSSTELQIKHSLLGRSNRPSGSPPHFIYSHPQALGQCRGYLKQKYNKPYKEEDAQNQDDNSSNAESWPIIKPVSSTSLAAQLAHEDVSGNTFAIASNICAEVYDLDIIEESIQDAGLGVL